MRSSLWLLSLAFFVLAAAVSASTPSVAWTIKPPAPSKASYSSTVAFVDEKSVVVLTGDLNTKANQTLQLFSVATQASVWVQPGLACPFVLPKSTTTTDPSSYPTTTGGGEYPEVFAIRRTSSSSLTYTCWQPGLKYGHVVTVDEANGNMTRTTKVHSGALSQPPVGGYYTVGSVVSGSYCIAAPRDAICVSQAGKLWRLGLEKGSSGTYAADVWMNEYNGSLAVQHADNVQLFDLFTGALINKVQLPPGTGKGEVAGARYLCIEMTYTSPVTVVTLDMKTGELSDVVTLPGKSGSTPDIGGYTGQGASSVALMVGDGHDPHMIVSLPDTSITHLIGWKVPATNKKAVTAKNLFVSPFSLSGSSTSGFGGGSVSWAVSPGYVIVQYGVSITILEVGTGNATDHLTTEYALNSLSSVSERDAYVVATGSTFSGGVVMVVSSKTGKAFWSASQVSIAGPDLAPIDKANGCVMVVPNSGSGSYSTTQVPREQVHCLTIGG